MTPRLNKQGDLALTPKRAGAATVAALLLASGLSLTASTASAAENTDGPDTSQSTEGQQTPATQPDGQQDEETEAEWTASVGGKTIQLTADSDGTLKGSADMDTIPGTLTVTDGNGTTFTIAPNDIHADSYDKVGIITRSGTASYQRDAVEDTSPAIDVQIAYSKTFGNEITLKNGSAFTKSDDGTWSATASFTGLNGDRTPSIDEVEASNGEKLPITWDKTGTVDHSQGAVSIQRSGTAAGTLHATYESDGVTVEGSWDVSVDATITGGMEWSVSIGDENHRLATNEDGTQSFTNKQTDKYPQDSVEVSSTVDGKTGTKATLQGDKSEHTASDTDKLGVIRIDGNAKYQSAAQGDESTTGLPAFDIQQPYSYSTGTEVTLNTGEGSDPIHFVKGEDGIWTATAANATLDSSNKPDTKEVALSNGDKSTITWDEQATVVEVPGADAKTTRIVRKNGTATGVIKVTDPNTGETLSQRYTVNIVADRAEDTHFTISGVNETDSEGKTTLHEIAGFDPNVTDYSITLPHSSVNSAYGLVEDHGVDATYKGETVSLAGDASRILSIDINGKTYKVTVQFEAADILAPSKAQLDGIYVNRTGETVKGDLIDGWNPNRLDYTVTIGENDPSVYVLPVSDDPNIRISANDVTQTAQSSKQTWTVTYLPTGESRTYSVTVNRPVETAVTKFTPEAPVAQEQTEAPESAEDTDLTSHGYVTKDGEYVTVEDDSYTIPEGGTFSYQAKAGQSAVVSANHINAMTYEYTVTVLPQDTSKGTAQHVFTVTYLTEATTKAQLDDIIVDGASVNGFASDKHEYTVQVNDPTQWTIVPRYDKSTGMSVTTTKNGADATITVVSGDGLNTVEYKVHATQKPFGTDGAVGVGGNLAQTGTTVTGLLASMIGVILAGFFAAFTKVAPQTRRTK